MGRSPHHAGSVPLIQNLTTGYITPQWNVVLDDWFSTVTANVEELPDFHQEEWAQMFGTSCYDMTTEDEIQEFENLESIDPVKHEAEDRNEEYHIPQQMIKT